MNKLLIKYYSTLSVFGAILALLSITLFKLLFSEHYFGAYPVLLMTFMLLTGSTFHLLWKDLKNNKGKFNQVFMIATTAKFLGLLSIIIVYIFIKRDNAVAFLVSILVLFILFLIFEVASLLWVIKEKKKLQNQLS